MKKIEAELFSEETNRPVIRIPGRAFPGILLQGDSIAVLHDLIVDLRKAGGAANEEAARISEQLESLVKGLLQHYETVLREHNLSLPYSRAKE